MQNNITNLDYMPNARTMAARRAAIITTAHENGQRPPRPDFYDMFRTGWTRRDGTVVQSMTDDAISDMRSQHSPTANQCDNFDADRQSYIHTLPSCGYIYGRDTWQFKILVHCLRLFDGRRDGAKWDYTAITNYYYDMSRIRRFVSMMHAIGIRQNARTRLKLYDNDIYLGRLLMYDLHLDCYQYLHEIL